MKNFNSYFQKISIRYDANKVFDDFITMSLTQFAFPSDPISSELHRNAMSDYTDEEKHYFNMAFKEMFLIYEKEIDVNGWHDFPGHFYENNILSKSKSQNLGQFFTPEPLCDLMAKIVNPSESNKIISDPTCGSGRNLLSYHAINPNNEYRAEDVDLISIKMATLNFLIHGMSAHIIWHNTLTEPNYARYLFITNPYLKALGVPHYLLYKNVEYKTNQPNLKPKARQLSLFRKRE